jgi:hypothetical protein
MATQIHNTKLAQKREERKRKDAEDSPAEKREVVMHGAKLKCDYAQGLGKLMVSSNEIKLQDQLWATEGDGNNMVNLQFKGTCGHPKWPAQNMSPPPCMSVIKLSPWQKLGTTIVQEQKVLVKESTITCTPDFNTAVASPVSKVASVATNAKQEDTICDYIIDAYWVDDNTGKNKTSNLLYKKNDNKVYVLIKFNKNAIGKICKIKVYDYDPGSPNDLIASFDFTVKYENTIYSFNLTGSNFEKGGEAISELFFTIKVDDCNTKEYCNTNDSNRLKVHLIRYIPKIMEDKGWEKGLQLQEKWFNGLKNSVPGKYADIANVIKMEWVLGFPRAKAVYDKIINEKIWVNNAGKNALIKELQQMRLRTPTNMLMVTNFGDFSLSQIVNNKNQLAPQIDIHHYQERAFKENPDPTDKDLDDLYAALANFVFRLAAKGNITKLNDQDYLVTITEVGIYVRDSFDYNDEPISITSFKTWISQPIGYWSPDKNDASTSEKDDSYYFIQNSDYQAYRNQTGYGKDFLVYSDVKTVKVNDSFTVSRLTFDLFGVFGK